MLTGELRQGALHGVMVEGIATAANVPAAEVRRALTLRGSLPAVGAAALRRGLAALRDFHLEVGRPVAPMLAQSAPSVTAALDRIGGPATIKWKFDGVRVRVHHRDREVRVFTCALDDITPQVPELVETTLRLPETVLVLDGEVLALRRRPP